MYDVYNFYLFIYYKHGWSLIVWYNGFRVRFKGCNINVILISGCNIFLFFFVIVICKSIFPIWLCNRLRRTRFKYEANKLIKQLMCNCCALVNVQLLHANHARLMLQIVWCNATHLYIILYACILLQIAWCTATYIYNIVCVRCVANDMHKCCATTLLQHSIVACFV